MCNIRYVFTYFLCIFTFCVNAQHQPYLSESWTGTGGLMAVFSKNRTVTDNLLNVYVAGSTVNASGNIDIIIQKFNTTGILLWQQTFNGTADLDDMAADIYIDNNYNVYITGTSVQTISNSYDLVVLKYNNSGSLLWTYYYDHGGSPSPDDGGTAITGDGSSNVFVTGASMGDSTLSDFVTIRLNASGVELWKKRYDYTGLNEVPSKILLESGNVVVSGASQETANTWKITTVIYAGTTGDHLSQKRSGGSGTNGINEVYDITSDGEGNLYITGAVVNANTGYDVALYKLNGDLQLVWESFFDGYGSTDKGYGIKTDLSGNIYVAGYTTHPQQGTNFLLQKYNYAGEVQWSKEYNGQANGDDEAIQLVIDPVFDRIFMTGAAHNADHTDYQTVMYTSDGDVVTQASYNGPAGLNDRASAMAIDSSGNVIVAGQTQELSGFTNRTVKYSFYEKPVNVAYVNGHPSHNSGELLIRFDRSAIITSTIDKKGFHAGKLMDFVKPAALTVLQSKTGLDWSRLPAYKIFRNMTTGDSLSVTRLGDTIRLDDFWATLSVYLPSDKNQAIIDSLSGMYPLIHYAERNYVGQFQSAPNDPQYSIRQNSLYHPGYGINIEGAWDKETGRNDTKVGVFDSGIYWNHEDFGDSASQGGKVTYAWDLRQNVSAFSQNEPDYLGHGTWIAGVIGALRNNGKGIAGIAGGDMQNGNYGCRLYSYTIYTAPPQPASIAEYHILHSIVSEAIVEGASQTENGYGHGLHVQNHSWGTTLNTNILRNAVRSCYLNSCAFVVSSGNLVHPDTIYYPASYDDAWVVRVGAVAGNSQWADFSTYYQNTVDVVAAGGDQGQVQTTDTGGNLYLSESGTSLAAPHASGVIALMNGLHRETNGYPNKLAPEDYEYFLEHFAKDINAPGYDQKTGHGIINATEALMRMSLPAFYVKHSGVGGNPVQTVTSNMQVNITSNMYGIMAGQYLADRYLITNNFTDIFGSNETVIDHWKTYNSSNGVSASTNITGISDYNYSATIVSNTANVSTSTYCWHIIENNNGDPLDIWIPAPPDQIETTYSLYVANLQYAGIDEEKFSVYFDVHPNPTSDLLTISYLSSEMQQLDFEIIDAIGKIVNVNSIIESGMNYITIDISQLPKGLYICSLNSGQQIISKRFIKK